jgi:hypothetical protein
MPKQITLRFVVRTLAGLRHTTKIGANVIAYTLMKKVPGGQACTTRASRAFSVGDGRADERANRGQGQMPGVLDGSAPIADGALRILRQRDGRIGHAVD